MPYRPAQQTLDAWEFAVKTVPGVDMRLADMPPGGAVLAETMFGRLVRPGTTVRDETVDAPPWVETVHETYGALPAFARSRAMLRGMSLQTGAGVYGRHVLPALAELASAITAAKDDVDEDADQEDAPASAPTTMEEALANLRAATLGRTCARPRVRWSQQRRPRSELLCSGLATTCCVTRRACSVRGVTRVRRVRIQRPR